VSGEIDLEKLIDTLMRTAIEHAGAERGLLILTRGDEHRIEAEATTSSNTVTVGLRQASVTAADLPQSVLQYVVRTKENVLLDDASAENPFSTDEYIRQHHSRSILCLPLLKQAKLIGVLYLENNLTSHVFTPARMAVLKLLASEAAISLENTRLYSELTEREARIRRLVEANIIGIVIWNLEGRIIEANEAFLRVMGYGREDLVSGRVSWREITPDKWRDADEQAVAELSATGVCEPFEKEYFRKDGSRVPVLVGAALVEGTREEGVAFVLDLTERKLAEETLRKTQAELAHVTRVTTLGEMTASIAHEINQPLAAVVNNASACLRWLAGQAPNLEEARQSAALIIADGHRAGEIIGRIRALAKKSPPRKDWLDINETILEVTALARSEVQGNRVSLETQLADDVPLILGDRIQLQQVILNLIINAIEAMSGVNEGPRELLVGSGKDESRGVLVTVRDSGPGLDPESLDHLFTAFFTTKPQGMGMGLAISRSIIEAHGGRLWATLNAPRGAVFQFTLPYDGERRS
jgi:PAS domain S-box-containing protein